MSEAVPAGFQPVPPRGGDFIDANGPVYLKREGDQAILGFRLAPHHCGVDRVAQGGVLVAMLDHLARDAIGRPAAAASLTCDVLAEARLGAWVEVRCQVTRAASAVIFLRGEVQADGQTVMTISGLWEKRET